MDTNKKKDLINNFKMYKRLMSYKKDKYILLSKKDILNGFINSIKAIAGV